MEGSVLLKVSVLFILFNQGMIKTRCSLKEKCVQISMIYSQLGFLQFIMTSFYFLHFTQNNCNLNFSPPHKNTHKNMTTCQNYPNILVYMYNKLST